MADISKIDFGDGVERNVKDAQARTDLAAKENLKLASSGTTASGEIRFGVDGQGNYGYIKAGADTVTPFRTGSGNLQEKTVTITPSRNATSGAGTTEAMEITADTGYDGMSKANVSTPQLHDAQTITPLSVVSSGTVYDGDTQRSSTSNLLVCSPSKTGMAYTMAQNGSYRMEASSVMGNATAADVRQGKTFTSGSGIAQTGSLVVPAHIYGATWSGGSSPAWTRTDGAANFSDPNPYYSGMSGTPSSPFDSIMPWAGMRKFNWNNLSDMTLVEIPKYWFKWTRSGASMQLQISNQAETGFYVSPAHADRGDGVGERDYVYVGRYHCNVSNNMGRSQTGVSPSTSMTRADFRTKIHNSGSSVWQWDFAMYWTIAMLYLVEFAHWNSQEKIGYGCGNGSSAQNTGASDTMPYHTGTMQSSRSTYGVGIQYRYIEDLWANVWNLMDGIFFDGSGVYCINNPADFSDTSGGTLVGARNTLSASAYTTKFTDPSQYYQGTGFEYALYQAANSGVTGSSSTYVCDECFYAAEGTVAMLGSSWNQSQGRGLFGINGNTNEFGTAASIGSRLMVLPSAQIT